MAIDGETVTDFIFWAPKWLQMVTAAMILKDTHSLEENLDQNITLMTKVHTVKAMVFPVVMYGCESWIIKNTECRRNDAFEWWCWRRLLSVPWSARRANQSVLIEITPKIHWKDWCWRWSSNTLATWPKELIHWKRPWCLERLKAGEGDDRA